MKRFLALALLLSATAYAGERLLGIISEINTTKGNLSQAPDGAAAFWDGGFEMPFLIPEMALVTVVCTVDMAVCTDKTACTVSEGLPLPANVLLPTSVGAAKGFVEQGMNPDAGLFAVGNSVNGVRPLRSASISIINPLADGGYHNCRVWERKGNE